MTACARRSNASAARRELRNRTLRTALREVRIALLEADVALPVVKIFIQQVQDRAVGQEVMGSLTPGQAVIKIVNEELISVMGQSSVGIDLKTRPPADDPGGRFAGCGQDDDGSQTGTLAGRAGKKSECCYRAQTYTAPPQSSNWKNWRVGCRPGCADTRRIHCHWNCTGCFEPCQNGRL